MSKTPHNATYLATGPDGSIIAARDDATISIFSLENEGRRLVEKRNGGTTVLVEDDALVAEAMFKALKKSIGGASGASFGSSLGFSVGKDGPANRSVEKAYVVGALCIAALIVAAATLMQLSTPRPVAPQPVVIQREAPAPTIAPPVSPSTPPVQLSVEEINAAKGPQLAPASTEPPEQPQVELPTEMVVTPDAELAPPAIEESQIDSEPTQTEIPAAQTPPTPESETLDGAEPVAPVETPANDDEAALESDAIFGDRLETNEAVLAEMQEAARADIAATGPDLAAEQITQMREAVELLRSGQKLSPEFVAQLPPEVATVMKERGLVLTPEEAAAAINATSDGPPISIVSLPAAVVDQYRDEDGIPSIPESNSWLALGFSGPALPLPGAGEIRRPEDLGRFGLEY